MRQNPSKKGVTSNLTIRSQFWVEPNYRKLVVEWDLIVESWLLSRT